MTIRLAVFDCDGTLVDSQANICTAMDRAFTALKLVPPDHHRTRRAVGLSLPQAMAALLPDGDAAAHHDLAEAYRGAFRDLRGEQAISEPLYPGMADLLRELHDTGWLLAVATGKSDRGLAHCLEAHGIRALFTSLQTADRHPSKPDPAMLIAAMADADAAPHQAVMIGDTSYDIAMAAAINVAAIGVDWGYHDPAELMATGASSVASSAKDLRLMLEASLS